MKLMLESNISTNLDLIIAFFCAISGFLILYLSYLFGIKQEPTGIAVLLTSLTYVIFKNKLLDKNLETFIPTKTFLLINNIIFVSCYLASIWVLYTHLYIRPVSYSIFISICYASVILDIFYSTEREKFSLSLIKILLLVINLQSGIYYEFPGPLGTDAWYHEGWIKKWFYDGHIMHGSPFTLENFFLKERSQDSSYALTPIFHIFIIVSRIITSMNIKDSYFLIGFAGGISTIFIFLIGRLLYNYKASMLAMVLLSITPYYLHYITEIMPMTLGFSFFIIILYLLLNNSIRHELSIILLILNIALILTHSLASFITLIIFIVLFLVTKFNSFFNFIKSEKKCKNVNKMSIFMLFFFLITLLFQWMRESSHNDSFIEVIGKNLLKTLSDVTELGNIKNVATPDLSIPLLLNNLPWFLFLAFGLFGLMMSISKKNINLKTLSLTAIVLSLMVFAYGFPLFGMQNILPIRWFVFISIIFSLFCSYGIIGFSSLFSNSRKRLAVVTIFILLLSFLSNNSSLICFNNQVWWTTGDRVAYTTSELQTLNTLLPRYSGIVNIDYMYVLERLTRAGWRTNFLNPDQFKYEGLTILRKTVLKNGVYFQKSFGITSGPYILNKTFLLELNSSYYNLIYDNDQVLALSSKC